VAFFAHYGTPYFWLKRNSIVLPAVVADYLITSRSIRPERGLFRTAFWTPLRLHHVPLIEHFLFFFGKDEDLFALNAWNFNVWHS
jgi:hypothetical protein